VTVGRNPHDIGRRILLFALFGGTFSSSRNPHDIGRRILLDYYRFYAPRCYVAILMTLEGEYYTVFNPSLAEKLRVAILMTLEGEYY